MMSESMKLTSYIYVLNTAAGQGAQILVLVNMENSPILEKARCSRIHRALHLRIADISPRIIEAIVVHADIDQPFMVKLSLSA